MHPLLLSQLEKAGLSTEKAPDKELWDTFLSRVSITYTDADNDRMVLEKAAELAKVAPRAANASAPDAANAPVNPKSARAKPKSKSSDEAQNPLLSSPLETVLLFDDNNNLLSSHNAARLIVPRLRSQIKDYCIDVIKGALGQTVYDELMALLVKAKNEDTAQRLSFDLQHAGDPRPFEAKAFPVQNVSGVQTIVTVHSKLKNEAAPPMQEGCVGEQIYKDLFDAASEGMLLMDSEQRVILANKSFERMSGLNAEYLCSQNQIEFFDPAGESLNTKLWSAVYFDDTWSGEATFHHDNGMRAAVWLTVDALKDNDGENSRYLVLSSDVTQLKDTQDKLAHFATHDQLTGLPNRAFFQDHLGAAILRSQRNSTNGALFFMDLDNFKSINDTLGHPVGDALLLEMSNRLKQFVRDSELVSRIGGDEFTLVVENLENPDDAAVVAQRLLKEFDEPFLCDGQELDMGCSIGVTVFPQDGNDRDKLIRQADTAMYGAKQAGRSTFKFYTSKLTHTAVQKFNLESQLRRAIERDELFLNLQPQIDMKRRKLIGAEVLLRWENEQHGLVSPADFIPVAEASGLIESIGDWVLDRVCLQINHWQQITGVPCLMSVNVSRKQLVRNDFVKRLADIMQRHDVSGKQLEIEVTESAIATSEKIAIKNLHGIQELGCMIAIDDFGTGYSSLSSLQKFPLDRLKIDRSFVMGLGRDPNADAIIAAIIALAKTLDLGVIAEGVETRDQVKILLKKGCREAQGYYYSKPLLASEFREYIRKSIKA